MERDPMTYNADLTSGADVVIDTPESRDALAAIAGHQSAQAARDATHRAWTQEAWARADGAWPVTARQPVARPVYGLRYWLGVAGLIFMAITLAVFVGHHAARLAGLIMQPDAEETP